MIAIFWSPTCFRFQVTDSKTFASATVYGVFTEVQQLGGTISVTLGLSEQLK
jgi:hypothetical protein